MRFLVFELLSILHFIVVNIDLGLERLAGKQRIVALRNMPLSLICFALGVNPKASGARGWSPGGG